jgi:alpha-glucosidase
MARQSGDRWFVGGMNGDETRSAAVPMEFLGPGSYVARVIMDADEVSEYPDRVWEKKRDVKSGDTITLPMAPGGGFVIYLRPAKN